MWPTAGSTRDALAATSLREELVQQKQELDRQIHDASALLNVMGVVISKVDEETRERGFIYRLGSWMFGLSSPADVSL